MLTDDVDVPDAYQNTLCPTIASNDEMSRRSVFDDSKVLCYIHAINLNPLTLHLYTFLEITVYVFTGSEFYALTLQILSTCSAQKSKPQNVGKPVNHSIMFYSTSTRTQLSHLG